MLLRRLVLADLVLISIGAIIGSGIFRNPSVVAQRAHTPVLILCAWIAGGAIALLGAFIFAELGARRPHDGGLYAYLRDAYHPVVAFMFGWATLSIADSSGTAASAITFAGYIAPAAYTKIIAVGTIAVITTINCLGVRQGGNWQNALVVLKVAAITGLIFAGLSAHPSAAAAASAPAFASPKFALAAFGVAMIPILFAYNGFQTASYVTGETRDPARTLPLGLLLGVSCVVIIYVLANIAYLRVLGPAGLAASQAPAADVLSAAVGPSGAKFIAIAIALSTLGFMSTKMLLTPRIYFQMAADGTFFKQLAWVHPKTRVPVVSIALYGLMAALIALAGSFEQILNWSLVGYAFLILAAAALFIFRARDRGKPAPAFRVPGHPFTTLTFIAAVGAIFVALAITYPIDMLIGGGITLFGGVVYVLWRAGSRDATSEVGADGK